MKIYTKTGDKGTTRLVDGSCVEKFNPQVEAYGTVDELNSALGFLCSLLNEKKMATAICTDLVKIQHWLFNAGSLLATQKNEVRGKLPQITPEQIDFLEKKIDFLTEKLPTLKNFILPGGDLTSAQAHMCRTICRRAERRAAEVTQTEESLSDVLIFLNRLSDYLFTLARYLNVLQNHPEILWNKESHV